MPKKDKDNSLILFKTEPAKWKQYSEYLLNDKYGRKSLTINTFFYCL